MTVLHKKQIVLGALVIMVGVAGYLNWKYEGGGGNEIATVTVSENSSENEKIGEATFVSNMDDDYFLSCRNNRETVSSKSIELLQSVINNANTTQEAKDKAQAQIFDISKSIEAEGNIENLIKAKGFEDVVVFINDGCVTVTVRTKGLTASETAKIKDIILGEIKNNNIKIVEVK